MYNYKSQRYMKMQEVVVQGVKMTVMTQRQEMVIQNSVHRRRNASAYMMSGLCQLGSIS